MNFAIIIHPVTSQWHFGMLINNKPWLSATPFISAEAAHYMATRVHGLQLAKDPEASRIVHECLGLALAPPTILPHQPLRYQDRPQLTCPKCNGTGRIQYNLANDCAGSYKRITAGYDPESDTIPCNNCGGQTMSSKAVGTVVADPSTSEGCWHEFEGREAGRCYTIFTCKRCKTSFDIDSGD